MSIIFGGSGEIRTHGPFRIGSFQDCCNKPTLPRFRLYGLTVQESNLTYLEDSNLTGRALFRGTIPTVNCFWLRVRESNPSSH